MNSYKNVFLAMLLLVCTTTVALAYIAANESSERAATVPSAGSGKDDGISIDTALSQTRVLQGGPGTVSVALTISAENVAAVTEEDLPPVDLVVVLDRSGSMNGRKLHDARTAVLHLLERLSPRDRLSVITYSNNVEILFPLVNADAASRERLKFLVGTIHAGGGTNLGSGLKSGIATLMQTSGAGRQRKVILISDGLANHGVTSPPELGAMAAAASEYNLAVSTVGVGYDFNELVMTTIADHGAGNYYYLESPHDIAAVFAKEFETTRAVAAGGMEIRIPLGEGQKLVDAGGFPIKLEKNEAVIYPGTILAGRTRRIFLSYQVPTRQAGSLLLGKIEVSYQHHGESELITASEELRIDCVPSEKEVIAGINEDVWVEQVLREDYGRLKEHVAAALRSGKKDEALQVIEEYEDRNAAINSSVDSDKVSQNLNQDLKFLRKNVLTTFAGAPAAVAEKKKQYAKELQYEGYQVRRDKK